MKHILSKLSPLAKLFMAASIVIAAPASAQGVESFDPDAAYSGAIDGDLAGEASAAASSAVSDVANSAEDVAVQAVSEASDPFADAMVTYSSSPDVAAAQAGAGDIPATDAVDSAMVDPALVDAANPVDSKTYGEDDLIGAAEGIFGKGAKGVAKLIQNLLKDQGEPNGYIVGREAGGAFIIGARYGSGTLHHKVEGERKVYWTGPSIGFDAGANAGNTFVLVYNLFDTEDLYKRYPAGEGQAYLVGGLHASYVRRGDVVMIPIRVGAGLRLGVNAGYMKFSKKQRWLPF
jgi:hypothetical protein